MANSHFTMKVLVRGLAAFVVVLVLVVPAALAAPPSDPGTHGSRAQGSSAEENAAKKCKAERAAMGVQAFNDRHGTNANKRNAFGKCVSGKAKKSKDEKDEREDEDEKDEKTSTAAKKCKAERAAMGVQAFNDRYGENANKRNALGKCVSKHSEGKPAKP